VRLFPLGRPGSLGGIHWDLVPSAWMVKLDISQCKAFVPRGWTRIQSTGDGYATHVPPPPGGSYLWTPSALATVILVENDLANRCKNCSALAGILQSLRCPFRARINLVNAPNGGSVKGGICDESFRMKQACLRRVLTIGVVLRVCLATFVDHDDVVRPPTNNAGPPNRSGTNLICEATN
jgi:hypothetical protein